MVLEEADYVARSAHWNHWDICSSIIYQHAFYKTFVTQGGIYFLDYEYIKLVDLLEVD